MMDPNREFPTVGDFMTAHPCVIDEGLSIADAMDRMLSNNIRHLLVVRDHAVVGVVDVTDLVLITAMSEGGMKDVLVARAVRRGFRCAPTTSLDEAVRMMEREHYGCAMVVDETNVVVGIFTITDALRALRQLTVGHRVTPEVVPTHEQDLSDGREHPLPRVRARRILERRHAAPSASDGLAFGSVGL